jgi:hypothetical protein
METINIKRKLKDKSIPVHTLIRIQFDKVNAEWIIHNK